MSSNAARARTVTWLWPLMLLLGLLVAPLAWMLALITGRQVGWMAVLAALELVFMLRLGTLGGPAARRPGRAGHPAGGRGGQLGHRQRLDGRFDRPGPVGRHDADGSAPGLTLITLANGTIEWLWLAVLLPWRLAGALIA